MEIESGWVFCDKTSLPVSFFVAPDNPSMRRPATTATKDLRSKDHRITRTYYEHTDGLKDVAPTAHHKTEILQGIVENQRSETLSLRNLVYSLKKLLLFLLVFYTIQNKHRINNYIHSFSRLINLLDVQYIWGYIYIYISKLFLAG